MKKLEAEDHIVRQQPGFATNRVALAKLLEEQ